MYDIHTITPADYAELTTQLARLADEDDNLSPYLHRARKLLSLATINNDTAAIDTLTAALTTLETAKETARKLYDLLYGLLLAYNDHRRHLAAIEDLQFTLLAAAQQVAVRLEVYTAADDALQEYLTAANAAIATMDAYTDQAERAAYIAESAPGDAQSVDTIPPF